MKMKIIKEYIRKDNGQLKGCLVAIKKDDRVAIGHSICRSCDTFNKKFATELAVKRAEKILEEEREINIPKMIQKQHWKMFERATKFFKGYTVEH